MLIISGLTMLATKSFVLFASIYTWHLPQIFMEVGQMAAWIGVSLTGLIAVLNFFGVKIKNPFKRKK